VSYRWSFDPAPPKEEIAPLPLTERQRAAISESRYRQKHRARIRLRQRELSAAPEQREKKRIRSAKYRADNRELLRQKYASYYATNREIIGLAQAVGRRVKKATNPEYRLICSMRTRIRTALNRAGTARADDTMDLIGCSSNFLRRHMEVLWEPGMSWGNYGFNGWHIDHIKPCCLFDLSNEEDQRQCFHWTNLQPLWWQDNLSKGTQY
jgi:hypothetical protein